MFGFQIIRILHTFFSILEKKIVKVPDDICIWASSKENKKIFLIISSY